MPIDAHDRIANHNAHSSVALTRGNDSDAADAAAFAALGKNVARNVHTATAKDTQSA
jgi:hypothetical protein